MKRIWKYLMIISVNISVLLALLELIGVATYYYKEHGFFYLRSSPNSPEVRTGAPAVSSPLRTRHVLHPILGFIGRPGTPVTAVLSRDQLERMAGSNSLPEWSAIQSNNFGFFSSQDYPYHPADNPFLIGVFGGSVAQWFVLQGASALTDRLRQAAVLRNRRIQVLNFGQGAFKQPQQLQALAYFLATGQPLDFVINIDGFNELALSMINIDEGIDPSQPSSQQMIPLVSLLDRSSLRPENIEAFDRAKRAERWMKFSEEQMAHTSFGSVWLLLELMWQISTHEFEMANNRVASGAQLDNDLFFMNSWAASGRPEQSLDIIVSTWMQASLLMDSMLCGRGIPYLHVVQPNQYYSRKTFSNSERQLAFSSASPFSSSVRIGYPRLLARIPEMRARGTNIVSAVGVFDRIPVAVYVDNCCHFNQLGNDLLARFIADRVVRILASQRHYNSCTPVSHR